MGHNVQRHNVTRLQAIVAGHERDRALEAGLPPGVALPIHAAIPSHGLGVCIWEGESVDAVREVVEGAVGPWAQNEYYEMQVDGLVPQLTV